MKAELVDQDSALQPWRMRHIALLLWLALFVAFGLPLSAAISPRARAQSAYGHALRMQEALESRLEYLRRRADYDKVIRAFQAVYRADPAYSKAPAALAAVGKLYRERGREFSEDADYEASIKAQEILAAQYPHSSLAREALLTIGEIYYTDLQWPEDARRAYQKCLERYPKSTQATAAQHALKLIDERQTQRAAPQTASHQAEWETSSRGQPLLVNDVRRWLGLDYTRIVISVEGEVQFTSQRVANPDRLVFDLSNTRLSPALIGKTFPVEDGFLRRIRVGQYRPAVTRVVLDVEQIEDYSVFSLPNPCRLVIDLHGKSKTSANKASNLAQPHSGVTNTSTGVTSTAFNSSVHEAEKETQAGQRPLSAPLSRRVDSGSTGSEAGTSDTVAGPAFIAPVTQTVTASPPASPLVAGGRRPLTADYPLQTASGTATAPGDISPASTKAARSPRVPESAARPSAPTESGSRTLTRALGLKIERIVIDPGHGGYDTGTVGPRGLREKDLVLDVALRLKRVIETKMGSEVIMTRSDDTFIPLEERTAIANEKDADLFVSIHANASRDPSARGVETYYLNFTSNPEALEVAARENATSQESVHRLQDLIQKIALSEKIEESRELAQQAQHSVYAQIARSSRRERDRGLKKAPFVVLIGANMPSILSEISFLTNPGDENLLKRSSYRQKIAEALYRGIASYVKNLGGLKVAQQSEASLGEPPQSLGKGKSSSAPHSSPANSSNF